MAPNKKHNRSIMAVSPRPPGAHDSCNININIMDQHNRRDRTPKRNMILTLIVISFLAILPSLQASLHLQRSLSDPSVDTAPPLASSPVTIGKTKVASSSSIKTKQRVLRPRDQDKAERSRRIDSSSLGGFVPPKSKQQLDFIIAGFPKTGTTSLLYAFGDHNETDIASQERCAVANPLLPDPTASGKLQEALSELSASPSVRRGIKCPNAVYHAYHTVVRLEKHSPNAKIVIGVRHPVEMLQSYYNYRVTELYDNQKRDGAAVTTMEKIPPLESLVGVEKEWKGVSTDSTRFDLYLMQFGKTTVNARDLQDMVTHGKNAVLKKSQHLAIKPNKFRIFLYSLDQLEDTRNIERSARFRRSLQKFLRLNFSLPPVGRQNLNHFVGKQAHPETVDICLPKYKSLRELLVMQGTRTARWLVDEFIKSPDVVVANREHFLENLQSWSRDPCEKMKRDEKQDKRHLAITTRRKRFYIGRGQKNEVIPVT